MFNLIVKFIGALVYLWLVDERNHILQTNIYKRYRLKKNVHNCSSVNLNVVFLLSTTPKKCSR